ncbi:hypothetical protein D9619_012071 [Psilocybe cf. subviscida]|uniref:pyranose dehydrogenase (acceptor) n=1 Tax=Psilocybe cf. subviscida TaxID=2480587 RepID=A0A8H5EZE9_9AGAR|nr:hypothetical protein D9619_012071 [Psilocybe cf. subviscida]
MYMRSFLSLLLASVVGGPAWALTTSDPSVAFSQKFDYIIVGAGTAGLTLANRLTANPSVSVLVVEAGVRHVFRIFYPIVRKKTNINPSDAGMIPVQAPFLGPTITPNTPIDWNYTVTPQSGLNSRSFSYPRGKLLGGSSSVNYLFHQFGSNEDWDRLANVTGNANYAWLNMRQYIQKHEKLVPPVDGHNTTNQIIPSLHGHNGTLPTSLYCFNQTIDPLFLKTTQELPNDFPYNEDMSGGDQSLLGFGFVKSSAGGGKRSSSSTTYLAAANARPNLVVLFNMTVTRLLQNATTAGPQFTTVLFTASTGNSSTFTITAQKEVILSAGAIGTPQILQLSGIGNSTFLKSLGLPPIVNNPSVGANLSDHTLTPNLFTVFGNDSFDSILRNQTAVQQILSQYISTSSGMFANNIANNFGFKRLPSNSTIISTFGDPAAGPNSPHWEMIVSNLFFSPFFPRPDTGAFMTIVLVLTSPTSRGSVQIASANAFDAPLINPNFLTTEVDIEILREGVRSVLEFVSASAWAGHVSGRFGTAFQNAVDDKTIDAYLRGITTTIFHPASTAMMTKTTDSWGVVNPDFTVKGTVGLRVVDASVFPFQLSCHPQGAIYLLSERASDVIASSTPVITSTIPTSTTTTSNKPSSSTTAPPSTTSSPASSSCSAKFAQCGGQGWTGSTCCQPGSTCQVSNSFFSQCL